MDFDPNCVCGGTKEKPQADDCERCRFVVEVERLRAELAAAKAASVVPVEIMEVIYPTLSQKPYDTVIVARTFDDMCRFRNWLRERMKERGEG